jgi:hypothetical protein
MFQAKLTLYAAKPLKSLERVKGIEPSYSAWKAAALPLSYTRFFEHDLYRKTGTTFPDHARTMTYHGARAASTVMARLVPRSFGRKVGPLTSEAPAVILQVPQQTKGGDPVSCLKRCHLAGTA